MVKGITLNLGISRACSIHFSLSHDMPSLLFSNSLQNSQTDIVDKSTSSYFSVFFMVNLPYERAFLDVYSTIPCMSEYQGDTSFAHFPHFST